jgi:hypothetical protein
MRLYRILHRMCTACVPLTLLTVPHHCTACPLIPPASAVQCTAWLVVCGSRQNHAVYWPRSSRPSKRRDQPVQIIEKSAEAEEIEGDL